LESNTIKDFLELNEVRAVYGGSLAWWRRMVFERKLPSYRRGDRVVFRRSDVDAYFKSRHIPAIQCGGRVPA